MSKANRHADLMIWAAQHWHEGEWRVRQNDGFFGDWCRFAERSAEWNEGREYDVRLIKRPCYQPRREIPRPETEAPAKRSQYFLADPSDEHPSEYTWEGDSPDLRWLAAGLVYLTKEGRDARVEAMLAREE